jgi:hypothetical protein
MSFAFHIEVAIGAGESDYAATADAGPNEAVTAQRVNLDPKCALNRWPPATI